ncbi:hypothetical protein Tco_0317175 [Tanacetum coccineum]
MPRTLFRCDPMLGVLQIGIKCHGYENQAPRLQEYVPEDTVPVYIPVPEHPGVLVPAEDEAPTPLLPPFFYLHHQALLNSHTPIEGSSIVTYPTTAPSSSRELIFPEVDTRPRKRLLLITPRPGCECWSTGGVTLPGDVCNRGVSEFCTTTSRCPRKDRAAVRAEIEILRRERLAYEQEGMETRQALARSEAHCRALEARVTVLETEARRHEWQRQAADDLAVQHIMRTQALEAGARVDTLEDTGSSS